jgi:hypothetical protein
MTKDVASIVVDAYSAQSMNSARSKQAVERILGPSDLGGCRAFLTHVLKDSPRDERQKPPWAAFVGTWVGEGLEQAYVASRPHSASQVPIRVTLPSGRQTGGTADVIDDDLDGVIDFKSLNGNTSMEDGQPPFKNLAQIMTYLLGAIQMGLLTKDATWNLVYVDRSGAEPVPVVISGTLDMDVIAEMEERISQAEYAAMFNEEPMRDEPISMCESFCQFFKSCRGDWQPPGLITEPAVVKAADQYLEGAALMKRGNRLRDEAKTVLKGQEGSTGTAVVRWTRINSSQVPAYKRRAHDKIAVTAVSN